MKTSLLLLMLGTISISTLQARAETVVPSANQTPGVVSTISTTTSANTVTSLTSSPETVLLPTSNVTLTGNVTPVTPAPTPEPGTLALMMTGAAGIVTAYKRKRMAA